MTQEDVELLLKDLCARQPYKVKIDSSGIGKTLESITIKPDYIEIVIKGTYAYSHFIHKDTGEWDNYDNLSRCKPYLRPMSSMTEEERAEFSKLLDKRYCEEDWEGHISTSYCIEIDNVYTDDEGGIKYPSVFRMDVIDWLNTHHFDYRGLIEKGLAVEVTEDNNPYKE